jgi:hypothetical protein
LQFKEKELMRGLTVDLTIFVLSWMPIQINRILYRSALLFLFLFAAYNAVCQPIQTGRGSKPNTLQARLNILLDRGYNIEKIVQDSSLRFLPMPDSILPGKVYWLKITVHNPNPSQRNYVLSISPQLNNTLYYFNPDRSMWLASRKDPLNHTGARLYGRHHVSFPGERSTAIFVKLDLTPVNRTDGQVRLDVAFQPEYLATQHEQSVRVAWVCCMVVLLVFMLNNMYIYWSFRDKAVLYYLIAQFGGMLYITSYHWFFHEFFPSIVFNIDAHGIVTWYDLNSVLMHLSIILTFYGLTAFTRTFLNTRMRMPGMDNLLRYGIRTYAALGICAILFNVAGYGLEHYTLAIDNLFCLLLMILILSAGIAACLKKLPFATTFLLANLPPFLFILAIPLSHLVISLENKENLWMPELAAMSQTIAFSIALVARTRFIQRALSRAEIDNRQLEFDLKEAGYRMQLNQMEIEKMNADINSEKVKNELLQQRLEANQRELASSTLYMVQKNELLNHLKSQLHLLSRPNPSTSQGLRAMSSLIDNSTQLDNDWAKFKMHFEQVHPQFFEKLEAKYPQLTMKETRLYAYFHMKLSHKEIASLLNIDPASVRRAKTRLYKKMAISETD